MKAFLLLIIITLVISCSEKDNNENIKVGNSKMIEDHFQKTTKGRNGEEEKTNKGDKFFNEIIDLSEKDVIIGSDKK
jgi:Skp family chaperone for outer membrane proteins